LQATSTSTSKLASPSATMLPCGLQANVSLVSYKPIAISPARGAKYTWTVDGTEVKAGSSHGFWEVATPYVFDDDIQIKFTPPARRCALLRSTPRGPGRHASRSLPGPSTSTRARISTR